MLEIDHVSFAYADAILSRLSVAISSYTGFFVSSYERSLAKYVLR